MGKIVAIGGGEIGRLGYPVETTKIDKEIIRLSGKKHPKFLFIPTASNDAELYIETAQKHFGQRLSCKVDTLCLVKNPPTYNQIRKTILDSDIIYVGGGNTLKMLKLWRRLKVDKILKEAYTRGIVLSGVSAGAICWFRYCLSDLGKSQKKGQVTSYKRLRGLDFLNFTASPHHRREKKSRRLGLIKVMKRTPGIGLALDDCAALAVIDGKFRVITSKPSAKVHKVYYKRGKLYYQPLNRILLQPEVA